MFTQTAALLLDAYRELQARKLFWATLVLSALVAGAFGFVSINSQGIAVFGHTFPGLWNSRLIPPAAFYQYIFTSIAIPGWLGFLATILALIAVGGIFPDLLVGGSIELYLSKPIGRLRLFLTKYLFALLFTAAQVFAFCLVSYVIIGLKSRSWDWRLFLAVPLVTLLFSYLYCVCVLAGILLRSTLPAILVTMLVWALAYLFAWGDAILTRLDVAADLRTTSLQSLVTKDLALFETNDAKPTTQRSNLTAFRFQLDAARASVAEAQADAADIRWWKHLIWAVESPLPKMSETVGLLPRWLVTPEPFLQAQSRSRRARQNWRQQHGIPNPDEQSLDNFRNSDEADAATSEDLRGRTLLWVLGTSLGFEAVILALAAWVFCRRDY